MKYICFFVVLCFAFGCIFQSRNKVGLRPKIDFLLHKIDVVRDNKDFLGKIFSLWNW